MAKQQINRKETKVATQEGVGQQYEQVVTVDDNLLPTAKELADYKAISSYRGFPVADLNKGASASS